MVFQDKKEIIKSIWLPIIGGPVLSLTTFLIVYYLDPLNLQEHSGITAFFVSVLILMISQWIATVKEIHKTSAYSDKIYSAIKTYLHVTQIGSPEEATRYITDRLPILREVQNTSFNTDEETERADEKLYHSGEYNELCEKIPQYCKGRLIWKDVGDAKSLPRLRKIKLKCSTNDNQTRSRYNFKIISHNEPQINFILLEYVGGSKEVLFNWDFRSLGQDPTVLISKDNHIVEMFAIQFNLLWKKAATDHDSHATKSTSEK